MFCSHVKELQEQLLQDINNEVNARMGLRSQGQGLVLHLRWGSGRQ
jgi:hypothetical protein